MRRYLLPVVFLVILALNAAAIMLMMELDGSKVTTKHHTTQQEIRPVTR